MTPADKAELKRFKRQQQKALTGREMPKSEPANAPVYIEPKTCSDCNGTGKFDGLLHRRVCGACNGCGFDISDPLLVIQHQARLLQRGRDYYKAKVEQYNQLNTKYEDLIDRYGRDKFRHDQIEAVMRGEDGKGKLD